MTRTSKILSALFAGMFISLFLKAQKMNTMIANGGNHVLLLKCNGQINSWGLNANGQLGDNSNISSYYPSTVRGNGSNFFLNNAIALATGVNHSLAITCDGAILAWGNNSNGQIGDNSNNNRINPVYVTGLPSGKKAIAIAAGEAHSLALMNDGTVWAWGSNQSGQLGRGNTPDSKIAVQVLGAGGNGFLGSVVAIACGSNSSFALLNDGTVRSWGKNNKGQLALGNAAAAIQYNPAIALDSTGATLTNITTIKSGNEFTLFLHKNGTVQACGDRTKSQLGDGSGTVSRTTPLVIRNFGNVKSIHCGWDYALAIKKDSTVFCWGNNASGQLGVNSYSQVFTPAQLLGINGSGFLKNVVTASCGMSATEGFCTFVIYNTNGSYYLAAAGSNTYGKLGNNSLSGQSPVLINNPNVTVNAIHAQFNISQTTQCVNTFLTFNNPGPVSPTTNIHWDFGDDASPAISNSNGPVFVRYSSAGVKTITLIVSDGTCDNCTDTVKRTITIYDNNANFTTSTLTGCENEEINFYPLNTDSVITRYNWEFGIGSSPSTSTAYAPKGIIYNTSGSKEIKLTVSNNVCPTRVSTKIITINPSPKASFQHAAAICEGTALAFTNTSTTGSLDYFWELGEDATPATYTQRNPPAVKYSSAGTKNVFLTIANTFGCHSFYTSSVQVLEKPKADFNSTAPVCAGLGIHFQNTGTNANVNASWNFSVAANPSGSTNLNPTHIIYTTSGIKTVNLLLTHANGCKDSVKKTIQVYDMPYAAFSSTAPQCVKSLVKFNNTGSTGNQWSYAWNFGADASPATAATEKPSAVTYSSGGIKTVTFTISDAHCSRTDTQKIVINSLPLINFSHTAPACTGNSVYFEALQTDMNSVLSWNFGKDSNPLVSSAALPGSVKYSSAGIKTVKLVYSNASTGCKDSVIQNIQIFETPKAAISSNAPQCSSKPINFSNTGTHGTAWTYLWNFGNNASPALSNVENPGGILYSTGGNKTITLSISDAHCSHTDTLSILIHSLPKVSFSSTAPACTGSPVNFSSTGTNTNVAYYWEFGDGSTPASSAVQNPNTITYNTAGIKEVKLVVLSTNTSCTDSLKQTLTIHQSPAVSFSSNTPACALTPVNFTNTGAHGSAWSYSWSFGNNALPATSNAENPGAIYYQQGGIKKISLTISSAYCTTTDTQSVQINKLPVAFAGSDTIICANTKVSLGTTPVSGYLYSWFPSNTLDLPTAANPLASPVAPTTTYIQNITDKLTGCKNADTVMVTMLAPAIANAGNDVKICRYDTMQIGAALIQGQTYSWKPALGLTTTTSSAPYSSPAQSTTYTLTVKAYHCPEVSDEVEVTVYALPMVEAGENDTINLGESIQLSASGAMQYTWTPDYALNNVGIYNPIAQPDSSLWYVVSGTDLHGCVNKDSIHIRVVKPGFWLPRAFTPDSNGINDVFYLRGSGISQLDFRIYNQWGEILFSSQSTQQGWDGRHQLSGNPLPAGLYVYSIKGKLSTGAYLDLQDRVQLIR